MLDGCVELYVCFQRIAKIFLKTGKQADNASYCYYLYFSLVPLAGIEPALLAELDFESSASTSSATGALGRSREGPREAGGL